MNLVYDDDAMRYETEIDGIAYATVDGEENELDSARNVLLSVLEHHAELEKAARACAADELLETKNESWLEENEKPVTRKNFMKRLELEEVEADEEGFRFWFNDDDMFWGHMVMVQFNSDGKPDFAEMMG